MKIQKVIDDKLLIGWEEWEQHTEVGGILIPGYTARNVKENRGKVLMVGENVTDVNVGDYIMYAVGTVYLPFDTDDKKVIVIPRDDVIMILGEEDDKN